MSWADWLLLGLVAGWFLYVLLRPRKKGGSYSCCSGCSGCGKEKKCKGEHKYVP